MAIPSPIDPFTRARASDTQSASCRATEMGAYIKAVSDVREMERKKFQHYRWVRRLKSPRMHKVIIGTSMRVSGSSSGS